ncbi:hypothetical protein Vretimale_1100 [Volvox reticuliferus]|uniref:Uncharacterized protein n=3 Tax=Volvox reticuliferus TaxID=1737510 RepID=A0A8J4D4K6_9CHLO|nr:hypothetical protein Vretimale_1100 [Volvox reticuliferus]
MQNLGDNKDLTSLQIQKAERHGSLGLHAHMEIVNHAKGIAARKRGGPQQATQSVPYHSFEPLKLERVYGSGSCTAAAIACPHPVVPGLLAYSCGAVVVLYDSQYKQQTSFFSPKPRRSLVTGKPYACVAFSRDGAYLAAGERSPQGPEILVWEVSSTKCLQSLKGHKHGIGSIAFSQDGRLLVSTGESYDGQLCVWDWQAGVLLARQHTQAEVQRACFAEELAAGASGFTITTVGKAGHFKVWSLTLPSARNRDGHLAAAGQASLTPRPASLKEYRTSNFVGVTAAPADGSSSQALLYALTQSGVLLTLRPATRTIDKSLSLQVPAAFALAVSSSLIACACAAGVVRLFAARTLAFRGNLPRPSTAPSSRRSTGGGHPDGPGNGGRNSSGGGGMVSGPGGPGADPMTSNGALFPDAVGCAFDSTGERLTVVYADRSLMVWDVRNPARVTRMRSVLSHAGIVWSAALIPPWQAALMEGPCGVTATPTLSDGVSQSDSFAPSSVLCTCGADGTVRLWNVYLNNSASIAGPLGLPANMAAAAKVTRTLRATIHAVPPAAPEVAGGSNAAGGAAAGNRRYAPDAPLPVPGSSGGGTSGGGTGVAAVKPVALRCLRVSPCGRHLATGDTRGNLRIFSLATLQLLMLKEAHDAEILSLDYSPPSLDGACYLVSGSRDTFVHVYDMSRGYELVGTCDAHGGAVTAVRFSAHAGRLALLSCSADKSVVFRLVQLGSCGLSFEIYHTERMSRGVLYDMAVDPSGSRAVAVAQDSQLRLFDVATGRALRNFSGDSSCGEAVAVTMDASGHLAICSCADGSVAIYDVDAGTLMARGSGHSDVCTGAVLLEDHRGLVTVGGDGCALLWRLSSRLAQHMQEAATEARRQLEQQAAAQAAMLLQQRQQQLEQQHDEQLQAQGQPVVTPTVRRRKAWDLGGAMDGSAPAVGQGGANATRDGDDGVEAPHQVQVDISATLLRIREGKPLLSLEKLPRWAQRTCTPAAEAENSGYCTNSIQARKTANTCANESSVAAGAPPLAGVWAQRAALPQVPPQQHQPEAIKPTTAVTEPPASAGDGAQEATTELPMPYSHGAAAATAAAAARASALAGEPRTWAEAVEEDDEIVFCDSLEDAEGPMMLLSDPQDIAAEVDPDHTAAAEAGTAKRIAPAHGSSKDRHGGLPGTGNGEEHGRGSPRSPPAPQGEADREDDIPASGCGSNRLGGFPREEAAAADGEAVKPRDLFREHFDSLGLDQASATKAPPSDPRRLSFSLMYRHARASSGAGGLLDGATTPQRPARASAGGASNGGAAAVGGGVAAPPLVGATAAAEMPMTPHLSKLPLLPTINVVRGGGVGAPMVSILDVDGAVTSAAWTPERAMLPLTSPALAKTDKQLQELERIRLRLLSTLRKRQTNDEVAMGAPPAAGPTGAAAATGPPEQPVLVSGQTGTDNAGRPGQQQQNQQQAAAAHAGAPAVAPTQQLQAAEPTQVTARASGVGDGNMASKQQPSREDAHSAGGFLLPPPPAYSPAGETPGAAHAGDIDGPDHLPPETPAVQSSPGFSSLTAGTPMLGKGADGADVTTPNTADGPCRGATVQAAVEDRSNRMFVFNPMYGASPTTPIIGPKSTETAVAAALQRGLSPRSGGAEADACPTCSPAGSDTVVPTADDVIRTVLEFEGGATAEGNAVVTGSGVCVIITEGGAETGDGKEQRQQLAPAAVATAPPAGNLESSAGKLQRSKLAPVKTKSVRSSAKPLNSLAATVADALACLQEPAAGAMAPTQTQGVMSEVDADVALTRLQSALRDFAGAYRRLITTAAIPAAAPSVPGGAASRYHAAARSAMAELEALLSVQDAAVVKPHLDSGAEVPPAVVCRSPQVSLDMSRTRRSQGLSRIGRGFKSGLEASSSTSVATGSVSGSMVARTGLTGTQAVSGSHPVSSSQVLLEVGLVESMVEEKLQQRMQEEMRRVEETVMQRIMQTMLQQQQQQ